MNENDFLQRMRRKEQMSYAVTWMAVAVLAASLSMLVFASCSDDERAVVYPKHRESTVYLPL